MNLTLKRLSATMCSHSSVPDIASYLRGSLPRYWRSIALHPRVIGALLLFASAEFAVAQEVDTEAISGTFANAPARVETINGFNGSSVTPAVLAMISY
jgi:hypothetical protein